MKNLTIAIALIFITMCCAIATVHFIDPKTVMVECWLPDSYIVVNALSDVAGNYSTVKSVSLSGTAVSMELDQFKAAFASEPIEMIMTTRGTVFYLCKKDGHLYSATKHLYWPPTKTARTVYFAEKGVLYGVTPDYYGAFILTVLTVLFGILMWRSFDHVG